MGDKVINRRKKGTRVKILGPHPWSGHGGELRELMNTPTGFQWLVKLHNGVATGVKDNQLVDATSAHSPSV